MEKYTSGTPILTRKIDFERGCYFMQMAIQYFKKIHYKL